jgi:hypothetical protein
MIKGFAVWQTSCAYTSSHVNRIRRRFMMPSRREWDLAVTLALAVTLSTVSPLWAGDDWPSTVSEFFISSELHISMLNYKADTGLQVTTVSSRLLRIWGHRFSIGIGYDDMVSTFHNPLDGNTTAPPISERLFLLHTLCDKRFQFTLQITW